MYKRAFIILLMAFPILLSAQSKSIEKFFDSYKGNDDYTLIDISGNLFKMTQSKNKKKSNIRIDGFQLLSAPKGSGGISSAAIKGFSNAIKGENFEELITIRDSEENLNFMVKESNDVISELVMIANGEENFTIMSLRGHIPTEELDKLKDEVEIEGLEHLKKN